MEALSPKSELMVLDKFDRFIWPQEVKERIFELFNSGAEMSDIAKEYNVTKNIIAGLIARARKSKKYDIPKKPQSGGRPKKEKAAVIKTGKNDPVTLSLNRKLTEQKTKKHRIRLRIVEKHEVTLEELNSDMCKWPIGDPRLPDFRYCGKVRAGKSPYCKEHSEIAYNSRYNR